MEHKQQNVSKLSRNQLIEQTFALNEASPQLLLLTRVIFDIDKNKSSLEQDIQDLYDYPERLTTSYVDEWRSWIKNVIHQQAFTENDKEDAVAVKHFLENQCIRREAEINRQYAKYLNIIEDVTAIAGASNVHSIGMRTGRRSDWLLQI